MNPNKSGSSEFKCGLTDLMFGVGGGLLSTEFHSGLLMCLLHISHINEQKTLDMTQVEFDW